MKLTLADYNHEVGARAVSQHKLGNARVEYIKAMHTIGDLEDQVRMLDEQVAQFDKDESQALKNTNDEQKELIESMHKEMTLMAKSIENLQEDNPQRWTDGQ